MSSIVFHPAFILIAGALLLPVLRGTARNIAVLSAPTLALIALWSLPEGQLWQIEWLDYRLAPLTVDKLSRLFATIFLLMAIVGGLFALRQSSRLEVPPPSSMPARRLASPSPATWSPCSCSGSSWRSGRWCSGAPARLRPGLPAGAMWRSTLPAA